MVPRVANATEPDAARVTIRTADIFFFGFLSHADSPRDFGPVTGHGRRRPTVGTCLRTSSYTVWRENHSKRGEFFSAASPHFPTPLKTAPPAGRYREGSCERNCTPSRRSSWPRNCPSPQLIARLKSPDCAERFHAACTLGQMGKPARKAVPALIETLKDGDPHVRKAAVLALGDLGPDAREAVPALCEVLLHDEEPTVRRRAAVALGEIGAEEAIPALEEASSQDDNEGVREMVAAALAEIDASGAECGMRIGEA